MVQDIGIKPMHSRQFKIIHNASIYLMGATRKSEIGIKFSITSVYSQ